MTSTRLLIAGVATIAAALSIWSAAPAAPVPAGAMTNRYEVTITNVTKGQIFAPAVVASHEPDFDLFELGSPARPELAFLAEEGDPTMLAGALAMEAEVQDVRTGGGVLMPGESTTITVLVDNNHRYLSLAGMLVSTNDAFFALRGVMAPEYSTRLFAPAYDAGSEYNSEDCAFIPGPPCGNGGSHDPTPAEGYVRIHEGIQGIGGVPSEMFDWRGDVAEIEIRRVMN